MILCLDGQYIDANINNQCSKCDSNCLLCKGKSFNCSKCTAFNLISYYLDAVVPQCSQNCPHLQFIDILK